MIRSEFEFRGAKFWFGRVDELIILVIIISFVKLTSNKTYKQFKYKTCNNYFDSNFDTYLFSDLSKYKIKLQK